MALNPDFELYRLTDEHKMLRAAVRELADDKIAPRAAETDETGEFPKDASQLDAFYGSQQEVGCPLGSI